MKVQNILYYMNSFRSETESFTEAGQGPNWGCSAKEKKMNSLVLS
jgi:hypothetical protein